MTRTPTRRVAATVAALPLLAAPALVAVAGPAHADGVERSRSCAGARIAIEAEKDDGRIEVDTEVDDAKPGARWRLVLKQNGKAVARKVARADRDGDIELDRTRPDTRGKDTFVLRATRLAGNKTCTVRVTVR